MAEQPTFEYPGRPELGDWQRSDSGPWRWVDDRIDEVGVHVMPEFGPAHDLSAKCWCHPVIADSQGYKPGQLILHNVAH